MQRLYNSSSIASEGRTPLGQQNLASNQMGLNGAPVVRSTTTLQQMPQGLSKHFVCQRI